MLLYHFVCPAKYRHVVFDKEVDESLKEICLEISKQFEIVFIEITTDKDHVHFLIQSLPILNPTRIIQTVESFQGNFKGVRDITFFLFRVAKIYA